jgi:hypothetical protein
MKKFIMTGAALAALVFAGCEFPTMPEDAGTITITGIPLQLDGAQVFKVYVSLSDFADQSKPHKAQGTKTLSPDVITDGKASVTIDLFSPPTGAGADPDPDITGAAWAGEAKFFSVTISPQTVTGVSSIESKAGTTFSGAENVFDWDKLMSLAQMYPEGAEAIYKRIVCKDDAITHP